eukprot:4045774-Prymnesium_polylepis.1
MRPREGRHREARRVLRRRSAGAANDDVRRPRPAAAARRAPLASETSRPACRVPRAGADRARRGAKATCRASSDASLVRGGEARRVESDEGPRRAPVLLAPSSARHGETHGGLLGSAPVRGRGPDSPWWEGEE